MPARKVALAAPLPPELAAGFAAIRTRLGIPGGFGADVMAAAEQAAAHPRLPAPDRTDLPLITIDPPGSRDLDQALHIARAGDGYVVSYAIADVAAFVTPGDPVDVESRSRGVTCYAPDQRATLHPPVLSEGAASLLAGELRPALLWTLRLRPAGELAAAEVVRARVRSVAQLSYDEAQAEIDAGSPRPTLALLAEVGPKREQRERDRGGVSLQIPEQEIRQDGQRWVLDFRTPLPVEGWNAQISLLTGMAAAELMLDAQVGILRTLPPAEPGSLRRLRQTARALRISWPAELSYPELVRSLDPQRPADAAMLNACTALFRGADYAAFAGAPPVQRDHAALAIPYTHVTAPLRRRVDRFAGEVCLARCAGAPVPEWVLAELPDLPAQMMRAERLSKKYERAIVDLMEVCLLEARVGEVFAGTVVEVADDLRRGVVMIKEPAVEAKISGRGLDLGAEVRVRLDSADWASGTVGFLPA